MKRETTNKINFALDNLLPPLLRDSKWLMRLILKMAVGKKYYYYMEFKDKLPFLNEKEINQYYVILSDKFIKRDTDLNDKCMKKILKETIGENILDAGAGKGFLAGKLATCDKNRKITALDIVYDERKDKNISYMRGSLTNLPFEDKSFDTVICTHALEHIKDVEKAVSELRRVCRKKLIVVLPRQRNYRYTMDLHIHFYPYRYNVQQLMCNKEATIELLDNDWFYVEYKI